MGEALGVNASRIAEATLRSNGGFWLSLRLPGMAASGDDSEQLGLATPSFQDVTVGPAVWRKAGMTMSLLLGSNAVTALVGSQGFASAQALFESAAGVVVDGVFYTISDSEPVVVGGVACGYRLGVVGPVRN